MKVTSKKERKDKRRGGEQTGKTFVNKSFPTPFQKTLTGEQSVEFHKILYY